jgi:hypothetical protein
MPWTPADAKRHDRHADDPVAQRQWAHVANGVRERELAKGTPAKEADAIAVREANGVVANRRAPTAAHPAKTAPTPHTHRNPR